MAREIFSAPSGDGHVDTAGLLKNGKVYNATLTEIVDTEKKKYGTEDQYEPAYRLVFMIRRADGAELGTISKKYKPSVNEKSSLYAVIKAITGTPPKSGFDLDSLVGRKCQIVADIWAKSNGEEANGIGSILPADDDDDAPAPAKLETITIQPRV